jgi:hypothetical protein
LHSGAGSKNNSHNNSQNNSHQILPSSNPNTGGGGVHCNNFGGNTTCSGGVGGGGTFAAAGNSNNVNAGTGSSSGTGAGGGSNVRPSSILITRHTAIRHSLTVSSTNTTGSAQGYPTMKSYLSLAMQMPTDPQVAIAVLSMPLYELGVCFRHGWGCAKSLKAAGYYFSLASKLGDAQAMYELGYLYLEEAGLTASGGVISKGLLGVLKSLPKKEVVALKMLAAQWLREAERGGVKVIGESWIYKEKWGGSSSIAV